MNDCLFCKIIKGEIPSTKVYEDAMVYAFNDIAPAAPVHILIIPKEHITSAADINADNSHLVSHIFEVVAKIAKEKGLSDGFRVVTNCATHSQAICSQTELHQRMCRSF